MRRFLGCTVTVALLLVAGVALAADVEGKVQSVDMGNRTMTLQDGTRVSIPDGIALDQLKEGADVKLSYEERDGRNVATDVEVK